MQRTEESALKDIQEHPERHRHDFNGLQSCCIINGALSTLLMEAHKEHANFGINAGIRCDVSEGPCACGAWH